MERMISWKSAEKISTGTEDHQPNSPERGLLLGLLELAIEDLRNRHLPVRKRAEWWIYEDDSREEDFRSGYISFYGACQGLGLDPEWVRKKLRGLDSETLSVQNKNYFRAPDWDRKRLRRIPKQRNGSAGYKRRLAG
ncbi:MAG: hypothetical protein ACREQA_18355 [Candidatus Binatia bacterium]